MPREKDLKRLIRARMKKTGEAYTAARAQLVKKRAPAATSAAAAPLPRRAEYAVLAGMRDDAVKEKSGHGWAEWVRLLDAEGAAAMTHRAIADIVSRKFGVPDWWTQTVTVGYERIKGLRARGQRRDGTYEATKTRTFNVPVATLYAAWAEPARRRRWLDSEVRARTATKPKSMRLDWTGGSIIAIGFTPKGKGKSSVSVQHAKLPDRDTANRLKQYWSERLDALAKVLDAP